MVLHLFIDAIHFGVHDARDGPRASACEAGRVV